VIGILEVLRNNYIAIINRYFKYFGYFGDKDVEYARYLTGSVIYTALKPIAFATDAPFQNEVNWRMQEDLRTSRVDQT
jgi:hypothetical protein